MTQQPIIYLVDDDDGMRKSIRWLLESDGFQVEDFAHGQALLDSYDPDRPGCMVIDLKLPDMTGLQLYDRLGEKGCQHPFVLITAHGDVPTAVRAIRMGAIDFMEKPFHNSLLLDLVRKAIKYDADRRTVIREMQDIQVRIDSLTPRERQVMELVAGGKLTKQIACELGVTIKTVEVHRSNVTRKMGVRSVAQLVNSINRVAVCESKLSVPPPKSDIFQSEGLGR